MAEKMVVSTRSKMSGTSYHLPSMHDCGNDFLELVKENGEQLVRGPSNRARNGSSQICYTFNTYNGEADHHTSETYVRTSAQIESTVHSFLDFTSREASNLHSLKLDPQHVGEESNLTDEKATQLGERSDSQIYSSTQLSEASPSLTVTLLNGGQEMKTHVQFQDTEANSNTDVNFSVFSRIAGGVKCTHRCSRVPGPSSNSVVSRLEEITADIDYEKPSPAEGNRKLAEQSAEGSNSYTLPQFQRETMVSKAKEKEKVVAKTCKESIADCHFEALDHQEKENAHARADETVYMVASSVGSSNAQTHSNYRNKHYRQPGGKRKYLQTRDDNEVKRTRNSKNNKFSEKKRRDKIRKKMRTLQQLIPSCKKMDKISVLDETIEYLKTLQLQLQLQIMSMGRGLLMPPVNTMIPKTTSVAPQSTQPFTLMTSGMDPINSSSMFSSLTQFPCLQVGRTTTAGIPGNMFQMFGFPWQMPVTLSIPQASPIPGVGNPDKLSDPVPHVSGATNQLGEHDSSPSKTIFRNFIPSNVNALHH